MIGLEEDLADRGGDDGVLSLRDVRQRVPHEVDAAALPGRADHTGDGSLETFVGVGDDQLHTLQAAAHEVAQEGRPERLGLARTDVQPDDLALALGVDRNSDYCRNADDASALADLEVGGVEPEVGPLACERALEEGVHPLVDVLAQLRDAGLGDAAHPHSLDQLVDAAGADAGDPGLLDHRYQRLLGRLAGLEEPREVRSGPELWNFEVQRAEPGIERAIAIAVAPGAALAGALVAASADQAVDIGLHDDLQHALGHRAQEVAVAGLRHQLGKG